MKLFIRIANHGVLAINIFLLFLLFFRDSVEFPVWMHVLGRMHPLMLHLPIGMLLVTGALALFRNEIKPKPYARIQAYVITLTALTASLTALFGFILSTESGYPPETLQWHLYTGVLVSVLAWALLGINHTRTTLYHSTLGLSIVVLLITGHLGSSITHGENFLWEPLQESALTEITDSTSMYAAVIHPVLKSRCESCHNEQKAKGELIMTSLEKIMAGGKHGPLWVAGAADSSHLILRAMLPEDHDDHMPPKGKPQLNASELDILRRWIAAGANTTLAWTRFAHDTLYQLAAARLKAPKASAAVAYAFEPASEQTIQSLNTPFCTVTPIAYGLPALKASFFVAEAFKPQNLPSLEKVSTQLVELNLSGMPVGDADLSVIGNFSNLEKLILNNTRVTGKGLSALSRLAHLQELSVNGLTLTTADAKVLSGFGALKRVYAWNTALAGTPAEELQKLNPQLTWDTGFHSSEILQLTPPLVVNEQYLLGDNEFITLRHNLPGTRIRYTLDGTTPDSTSSVLYEKPVGISQYTMLKARAVRDGWYASGVIEVPFFRKGIVPDEAALQSTPDKSYRGEGAATLINQKKGNADNYRDVAWLAFREQPFRATFTFHQPRPVKTITVSYARNMGSWLVAPELIEVWGGTSAADMKPLAQSRPVIPATFEPNRVEGITLTIPEGNYTHFRMVVTPTSHLPAFISKKREKAWFFVDEVIFN